MLAVLCIGVAIGATWIAMRVQATGCMTTVGPMGACTVLPTAETWTVRILGVSLGLFAVAFAAEYYRKDDETEVDDD